MPESNEVGDQQEYLDRNEVKQQILDEVAEGPREIISVFTMPAATVEQPEPEPVESRSGCLVEQSDLDELLKRLKLQPWQKQRVESWVDNLRQFSTGEQPESEVLSADSEFDRNESRWIGEVPPGGQIVRPEPESFTSE